MDSLLNVVLFYFKVPRVLPKNETRTSIGIWSGTATCRHENMKKSKN